MESVQSELEAAVTKSFRSLQEKGEMFFSSNGMEASPGGSCVVVGIVFDKLVTVANAGDTFALIIRHNKEKEEWSSTRMSDLHSCSNKDEYKRAVKVTGARIDWINGENGEVVSSSSKYDLKRGDKGFIMGMSADGLYRIQPTRSLLDYGFPGNICEPTYHHHMLDGDDVCLILCTDGVSDHLSDQQIVEQVAALWKKALPAHKIAKGVVNLALESAPEDFDRIDNTTAAILLFRNSNSSTVDSSEHSRSSSRGGSSSSSTLSKRFDSRKTNKRAGGPDSEMKKSSTRTEEVKNKEKSALSSSDPGTSTRKEKTSEKKE